MKRVLGVAGRVVGFCAVGKEAMVPDTSGVAFWSVELIKQYR